MTATEDVFWVKKDMSQDRLYKMLEGTELPPKVSFCIFVFL